VKNSFGCNIKCTSSTTSSIDPVHDPLPMGILIMIHFTICITKRIPILSNSKVWFTCFQVVLYIATPKSSYKVKTPPIIPNVFPEKYTVLDNYFKAKKERGGGDKQVINKALQKHSIC